MSCEYCRKNFDGKYLTASSDVIRPSTGGTVKIAVKANFCPMCGEPLTKPEPLNFERLKQMDEYPIWVKSAIADDPYCKGAINYTDFEYAENDDCLFPYDDYGKTWLAYTRQPKEG